MRSEKIIETLQTLKELLDDGLITELTEQEYEAYRRKEIDLWVQRQRQSEGEGGDRGQAPDAVVGTSSGRGREVSGQGSDTKVEAVAPVRREPLPQKRGRTGRKNGSSIYSSKPVDYETATIKRSHSRRDSSLINSSAIRADLDSDNLFT